MKRFFSQDLASKLTWKLIARQVLLCSIKRDSYRPHFPFHAHPILTTRDGQKILHEIVHSIVQIQRLSSVPLSLWTSQARSQTRWQIAQLQDQQGFKSFVACSDAGHSSLHCLPQQLGCAYLTTFSPYLHYDWESGTPPLGAYRLILPCCNSLFKAALINRLLNQSIARVLCLHLWRGGKFSNECTA